MIILGVKFPKYRSLTRLKVVFSCGKYVSCSGALSQERWIEIILLES